MLYKIRTMGIDAEAESGPVWSGDDDSRVLWCGRWLRKTHLDELPQLFQVVAGYMNLVGPRPERPEIVPNLANIIADYRDRLAVKPGVTGLAQITFGADMDLNCVRRKLILDKLYISTRTMVLDLRIILCTALQFFGAPYHLARRVTLLDQITSLDFDELLDRDEIVDALSNNVQLTEELLPVKRPR